MENEHRFSNGYKVLINNKEATIYLRDQKVGRVWIGTTGEWNVQYEHDIQWLPINDVLILLGYKGERQ